MTYKISVIVPAFNEEKYLSNALESLINQTFKDFEVIIINDGSVDDTQKIIDEYCINYPNFRGIYQKNLGVSTARNRGISESKADYVAFLDADDVYLKDALENLYKTASLNDAELVIGRMKVINAFGSVIYVGPKFLSNKINIDPLDKELVWTGSMCNKLFSRKKLKETGITLKNLKYSEDSLFILNFAMNCKNIVGCPHDIFLYQKRPFWEGYSATQAVNSDYLEDFFKGYEIIDSITTKAFQEKINNTKNFKIKEELSKKFQDYQEELYNRKIALLLNEFYRLFWNADEKSLKLINNYLNELKRGMTPTRWDENVAKFRELRIDNLIYKKKEMSCDPLITIVINCKEIKYNEIILMLGSIYSQNFPAFEIIVFDHVSKLILDSFLDKENFKILNTEEYFKNTALNKARGDYIIFIEENIFFEGNVLKDMYYFLQDPDLDFVSMEIYQLKANKSLGYIHQELAYSHRNIIKNNVKTKFNYLDLYLSNKLIKKEFLKNVNFKFSNDSPNDVLKLYQNARFKKLRIKGILSNENEKYFLNLLKCSNIPDKMSLNVLLWSKQLIYGIIRLRRHIKKLLHSIKKKAVRLSIYSYVKLLRLLPIQNRVFFYSIRSDGKLLDNSLSLYSKLNVKKIFISKRIPHNRKLQYKIYYYLLTSKVIITDDYLGYLRLVRLRKEQKVVQIWHACGAFKKFGLDSALTFNKHKWEIKTHEQYDSVIVSSEGVRKYYANAFGVSIDKIKPLGVPRTDMFFDNNKKIIVEQLYKQFPKLKGKKIILYCPTFRESKEGDRIPFDTKINWVKLSASLNENIIFIIKKHPFMREDLLNGKEYKNIIELIDIQTYSLMLISDLLVTDYSSVIFEYSLLNKPIIFYCPDYREYNRDFYLEYPADLPGKLVHNMDNLIKEIISTINQPSVPNLDVFKKKEMESCNGNSTSRVVNLIKDYLS